MVLILALSVIYNCILCKLATLSQILSEKSDCTIPTSIDMLEAFEVP